MKKKVRVRTISMHIGLTVPSAGYGNVKPSFGAEFEVPKGADPDKVRDEVIWPWVRYGFMQSLRRCVVAYAKADGDMKGFVDGYTEKSPGPPPLVVEVSDSDVDGNTRGKP